MSEGRWLDGYTGQTTDELIALEGRYRTDSIVVAFDQAIRAKVARIGDEQLTFPERVVLVVEALEREVNNDGYDGLFRNRPQHIPLLETALRAIDRDAIADLTRSAVAALGIDGPLTPDAIDSSMALDDPERDDRLEALDHAYYEIAGDLAGPLLAYIRSNRELIVLP